MLRSTAPSPADRGRSVWAHTWTFWRRSVQARVVVSVIVVSAVVIGVVGWLLVKHLSDELVDNRRQTSVQDAASETRLATDRLEGSDLGESPNDQMQALVDYLVERGRARGFEVVEIGPIGSSGTQSRPVDRELGTRTSPGVSAASVPSRLTSKVARTDKAAWAYTEIRYESSTGKSGEPGVAVGDRVVLPSSGDTYLVVLLFPFTEEKDAIALIGQSLLLAGAFLLVVLAALVSWLVTRQVVRPIRSTRQVAERIASGQLTERVLVGGEDDIARLGSSFNSMADSLQEQIRRLEDLSRVQRQFVSDVSHELRTPLTTVRMAGEMLHEQRRGFSPVAARTTEVLHAELERFHDLLEDLLEISRFDAGAAGLDVEDVDLTAVARRVVQQCAPLAEARDVEVRVLTARSITAEVDVRRVERVLRNLVVNAIDHSEKGRGATVELRLAAGEGAVAVAVRDHGVGLKPGQSAQVFNRFWRGDPARARSTGGTGLGLAIALEDARLHGGWLQAWGRPGEGAQFLLTLPRHVGDAVTHSPLRLAPADASSKGRSPKPAVRGAASRTTDTTDPVTESETVEAAP